MSILNAVVPTENRGYIFGFAALFVVLILAIVIMFKSPGQAMAVFEQVQEFILYLVGLVVGFKEGGKAIGIIGNGLKKKE